MKIKQIELESPLMYELETFYTQLLGFSILDRQEDAFFACQAGASILKFRKKEGSQAKYHFAFNIAHNQLESAKDWLKSKDIQLCDFEGEEVIDFPNWNAHALYFLDPAGNVLEFIARHDLSNASEEDFSIHQIIEISEIGLPVPSIKDFYERLSVSLKIPIYSQISNLKSFCAAGDAQGLFILVPLERAWFPTDIMNGIYLTKIWIEGQEKAAFEFEDLPYQIYASPHQKKPDR